MSYYEYTKADLDDLQFAFSDYLEDPECNNVHFFIVSQGIQRYLENWLGLYIDNHADEPEENTTVEVVEGMHFYILDFLEELIADLKARRKQNKGDSYWYEEYRVWLYCMQAVYKQLKAKKPY